MHEWMSHLLPSYFIHFNSDAKSLLPLRGVFSDWFSSIFQAYKKTNQEFKRHWVSIFSRNLLVLCSTDLSNYLLSDTGNSLREIPLSITKKSLMSLSKEGEVKSHKAITEIVFFLFVFYFYFLKLREDHNLYSIKWILECLLSIA